MMAFVEKSPLSLMEHLPAHYLLQTSFQDLLEVKGRSDRHLLVQRWYLPLRRGVDLASYGQLMERRAI
jgi:hypothetical protein